MKNLIKAIKKAEAALNKSDLALQAIHLHLKFMSFTVDDLPQISSCNGSHEIILEWHGSEINCNQIIYLMTKKGYIEPHDFIGIKWEN